MLAVHARAAEVTARPCLAPMSNLEKVLTCLFFAPESLVTSTHIERPVSFICGLRCAKLGQPCVGFELQQDLHWVSEPARGHT